MIIVVCMWFNKVASRELTVLMLEELGCSGNRLLPIGLTEKRKIAEIKMHATIDLFSQSL